MALRSCLPFQNTHTRTHTHQSAGALKETVSVLSHYPPCALPWRSNSSRHTSTAQYKLAALDNWRIMALSAKFPLVYMCCFSLLILSWVYPEALANY